MSRDKAIAHGKEHRAPYRGSKAIDKTCRNHGGCDFCLGNRMHSTQKRKARMNCEQEEMPLTKVFISQPMSGLPAQEIVDSRNAMIRYAQRTFGDVEILDTYFADFSGHPLEYLGKAISLMAQADVVCMVPGWENSRGCIIEEDCARKYGKIVAVPDLEELV